MLHQPTLLHSFEGSIQQLFPDSRELSMSSAKTIADILAFAELIDVKSFIGNPFTSQPMYIAACAFLAEAAAHASQPPSRQRSPSDQGHPETIKQDKWLELKGGPRFDQHLSAKHTLLATAANQNYQRCYKALQALETYWAGTRYILTALDQKSKGIMDPLLFTSEDIDSEMPSTELNFTTPGWRRSTSHSASMGGPTTPGLLSRLRGVGDASANSVWSPQIEPSHAIGWSLTGTTNSPAPNLSFLYQTNALEIGSSRSPDLPESRSRYADRGPFAPSEMINASGPPHYSTAQYPMARYQTTEQSFPPNYQTHAGSMPPPPARYSSTTGDHPSTTEADLLLSLHSPVPATATASQPLPSSYDAFDTSIPPMQHNASIPSYDLNYHTPEATHFYPVTASAPTPYSDMMIESQDVDMSGASHGGFTFPSGEMIPWLEYLPQDVLSYFGEAPDDGSGNFMNPPGPGPPADNG